MHKCALLAAATAGLLVVSGCSAPASPKDAVTQALLKVGQGKDAAVTARLDTTEADVATLVRAAAPDLDLAGQQAASAAGRLVPRTSIKLSAHSRGADLNDERDPGKMDGSVTLGVDGKTADLLWIDSRAFVHADADGIGQATGLFTGAQLRLMLAEQLADNPWMVDLLDGKWVEADPDAVAEMAQERQPQTGALPTAGAATAAKALIDASEVTKVDADTYRLVADAKALVKAAAAVDPGDEFTEAKAEESAAGLRDGATLDATLDVAGDQVSRVVVDVDDILRTWPKPDPARPATAALAAADFRLDAILEFDAANPAPTAPQATTTIPASAIKDAAGR